MIPILQSAIHPNSSQLHLTPPNRGNSRLAFAPRLCPRQKIPSSDSFTFFQLQPSYCSGSATPLLRLCYDLTCSKPLQTLICYDLEPFFDPGRGGTPSLHHSDTPLITHFPDFPAFPRLSPLFPTEMRFLTATITTFHPSTLPIAPVHSRHQPRIPEMRCEISRDPTEISRDDNPVSFRQISPILGNSREFSPDSQILVP